MNTTVLIALDGKSINLKNIKIAISMKIENSDQSGQSSSTFTTDAGLKPKVIKISGQVPLALPEIINELFSLASDRSQNGMRVYRIANISAAAAGVKNVIFNGDLSIAQDNKSMVWDVSFSLLEKFSTPELQEIRAQESTMPDAVENFDTHAIQMTEFEQNVLAKIDKFFN